MKFRVLNPRRRRARRAKRSGKSAKARMAYVRSFIHKKRKPKKIMARRRRSSKRRRSNPILAIGNPRRRRARRSRRVRSIVIRSNPRRRRSRRSRRHSNPSGGVMSMNRVLSKGVLTQVLGTVAGYAGARMVKTAAASLTANLDPKMQGWANVGIKVITASAGGYFISSYSREFGRAFTIGALFSAAWDVIALVTGNPVSLNEYVAPRTVRRGQLSSGALTALRNSTSGMGRGMSAYTAAFSRSF